MADTDISRVISLIMENPKLIEEIKELVEKDGGGEAVSENAAIEEPVRVEAPTQASSRPMQPKRRRQELLSALKPYISDERKRAVESFVSIAEILDMMREK